MKMGKGNVQARFHLVGVTLLLAACLMAFVATADGAAPVTDYHRKWIEAELDKIYEILEEISKGAEFSRIYDDNGVRNGYSYSYGPGAVNVIVGVLTAAVVVLILINCYFCYYLFYKRRASQASQSVCNDPRESNNLPLPQNNLNI